MVHINVEKILAPVADEQPCGENLEYDPEFIALLQAAQAIPEQVMGESVIAAKEPDWREVADRAAALLSRTKDLRVAVLLAHALLQTQGFAGLADGLQVIRSLLEQYWEHVHPQLDPDDDNDPIVRLNAIAELCGPETMLRDVRATPIVASRSFGVVSYRDVAIATGEISAAGDSGEPRDLTQINAAFMECDGDALVGGAAALQQAMDQLKSIDKTLIEILGAGETVDLTPLFSTLRTIWRVADEKVEQRGLRAPAAKEDEAPSAIIAEGAGAAVPARAGSAGEVASREDVIRLIDKICAYYERYEPSSPVPLLLKRAKRLVAKSFIDILRDLAPDGVAQVEVIRGADADGARE